MNRLLTAAAAVALAAGLSAPQIAAAQSATPKTEAGAAAVTGKATTDAPAATAVQGAAKAMQEGAAPVAAAPVKPVAVSGDLMDTLRLSGQFTTFVGGIDATNLAGLLKTNKNLTVFAPTDAAFAAMPPAALAKLKSDKAAMQKFVLHHVVNAPIPSSKIKGAKGPVPTGAGDQIVLDGSDEAGVLKVDDATIVQADLQTSSGLLQVIDKVLADPPTSATAAASPASATAEAPAKP